jgi:pimeloyl-ACP methyl ester carboxylesterase
MRARNGLAFSLEGQGPAIVLLHALALDRSIWEPQVDVLQRIATLVRIDLRGMGESDVDGSSYTWREHATDVLEVLDELGVTRAVFVGHSYSAWIVARVFGIQPHRVAALAFSGAALTSLDNALGEGAAALGRAVGERGTDALLEAFGGRFTGATTARERPEVRNQVDAILGRSNPRGITATIAGMLRDASWAPPLEQITCPALVLAGREDVFITPSEQEHLAHRMPGGEFLSVEAGHTPQLEAPAATSDALRRLLVRSESPGPVC